MKKITKDTMRLAKFLAEAGLASRRKSEDLIRAGRVKIAGVVVDEVSTNVLANQSDIAVDDRKVILERKVYYLLNKPEGYICSLSDPHNDKTVIDLVPKHPRVVPVGRLDKDSAGLLLLSNDGELIYQLTHPKFEVNKTYLVTVGGELDRGIVRTLKQGVLLPEGLARADKIRILDKNKLEIVIHQGWNRQIRRMLGAEGLRVLELTRIAEGRLTLGNLASGKYRQLKKEDIL